jgi:hypothetical protein
MRLHEFSNPLKHYLATVRVVLDGSSYKVTTTITADSPSDAKKLLAAVVGDNNVLSLSNIVTKAPQTAQIQQEQVIRPQVRYRHAHPRKVAQIQSSQVQQMRKRPQIRQISSQTIAAPIKHKLIQDKLTKHFMRQSNIVKPTNDDIRVAHDRVETELKRADLEFRKKVKDELRT